MKKISFFGSVKRGPDGSAMVEIFERQEFAQRVLEALGEGQFTMHLVEYDRGDKARLLRWYWHIFLTDAAAAMGELWGESVSKEQAHEEFKQMYAHSNGKVKTTTKMSHGEFKEYLEKCERHARLYLCYEPRSKDILFPPEEK